MPYVTGEDPGGLVTCQEIHIPDDLYFRAAVKGQLLELTKPEAWEKLGSATPERYAELAQTMYEFFQASSC